MEYVTEGRRREDILRHFFGDLREEEIYSYGALKDKLFQELTHEITLITGALEFLEAIDAAGLTMALGTSAGRSRAEETLQRLGLRGHFRSVVTGDDVSHGKPDPAVFIQAAESMGIEPANVLVCEDAVPGVQAAKRAGMKCLAIASEARRHLLEMAGADRVVEDFSSVRLHELRGMF